MSETKLTADYLAQLRKEAKDSGFLLCTRALHLLDEIDRLRSALDACRRTQEPTASSAA